MTDQDPASTEWKSKGLERVWGSIPWLKPIDKKRYRAKVFRSGNSLAVRIPAGTRLAAGMEMELTVEDGQFLSLEPAEQPRRKFNIAKVAGSAHNLVPIKDKDRVFEERPLVWEAGEKDTDPKR